VATFLRHSVVSGYFAVLMALCLDAEVRPERQACIRERRDQDLSEGSRDDRT